MSKRPVAKFYPITIFILLFFLTNIKLLAIDAIEEQFGLKLTGPYYRVFKLTYGVPDRGLHLLAYKNVSCSAIYFTTNFAIDVGIVHR